MIKKLIGCLVSTALLAGCGQKVLATPVASPPSPHALTFPMIELMPVPLDADIPGTTYDAGLARSCNKDMKSISFTQSDVTTSYGSGVVEKTVEGGTVTYDISKGSRSGSDVPDGVSITLSGNFTPIAVIVNSRHSAPFNDMPGKTVTVVIPGETFAPDAEGKIHGIRICYL